LFNPPGAAGPDGTPLTPCEPAPAEPALGEPAALPLLLPPDDAPPALWPNDATGNIRIVIAATAAAADASFIENLPFLSNDGAPALVPAGTKPPPDHSYRSTPGAIALAQIYHLGR
jgi:hypothetical protein